MTHERKGPIAGIVLAAGESRRMGQNKLLMELGGETVLRRAVSRAVTAGLEPLLVVLGHDAHLAKQELDGLPCTPVVNPNYAKGINSSLRAGMAQVPADAIAVVIALADMPLVTSEMLSELVRRYRESAAPLVISQYGDVNAPPMLYDHSLFPKLQDVEGEGCGRHVVRRHRDEASLASWPPEVLADLDVPEDYERIKASLAESSPSS